MLAPLVLAALTVPAPRPSQPQILEWAVCVTLVREGSAVELPRLDLSFGTRDDAVARRAEILGSGWVAPGDDASEEDAYRPEQIRKVTVDGAFDGSACQAPSAPAGQVPAFWVCMAFHPASAPRQTLVTFDVGAPATNDPEAAAERMREVRAHGGEWLPGPLPLPHGVPAGQLVEVWVDRFDEGAGTVCGTPVSAVAAPRAGRR